MDVREFEYESYIHGYHVYKEIWNSTVFYVKERC